MKVSLDQLYIALNFSFSDAQLLNSALTHRSTGRNNNERLEFLGDAILDFVIAEALYQKFPTADEGQLSRLRAALVKQDSLAGIARVIGLGHYLQLGNGELKSGGQSRDSILSDTLEALFAAIYLDGGFANIRAVILALFRERLDSLSVESHDKDPKTTLQEYLQAKRLPLPVYSMLQVTGEPHAQTFRMQCQVAMMNQRVVAQGSSRKKAEQRAARKMLAVLADG